MIGQNVKVLRIVSEPEKTKYINPYSLYVLEVEYGPTCRGTMHLRTDEYEAFLLEREILKHNVPFKLLEQYRDKIRDIVSFDESLNNEE